MEYESSKSRSLLLRHHNKFDYDSDSSSDKCDINLQQYNGAALDLEISLIGLPVRILGPMNNK